MAGAEGLAAVADCEVQVIEGVVGEQPVVAGTWTSPWMLLPVGCGSRSLSGVPHPMNCSLHHPPVQSSVAMTGWGTRSQGGNRHRLAGDQERPRVGIELVGTPVVEPNDRRISAG